MHSTKEGIEPEKGKEKSPNCSRKNNRDFQITRLRACSQNAKERPVKEIESEQRSIRPMLSPQSAPRCLKMQKTAAWYCSLANSSGIHASSVAFLPSLDRGTGIFLKNFAKKESDGTEVALSYL